MAAATPVRSGFRAIVAAPEVVLAEVGWRWAFAALVCVAVIVAGVEWLDSIQVSDGDLLLLGSMAPPLVANAMQHIFAGSGPRLLRMLLILLPALAIFWAFAAVLGRGATVGRLLGREFDRAGCRRALLQLSFLRLALALVTAGAFLGAALLIGSRMPAPEQDPITQAVLLVVLCTAIASIWSTLNWILSVAPIFVLRRDQGAWAAISETIDLIANNTGAVVATGLWFWLMRLFAVATAVLFSLVIAAALWKASFLAANLALASIALGYCALADFLYVARLAAYIAIADEVQISAVAPASPGGSPEVSDAPRPGTNGYLAPSSDPA